MLFSAHCPGPQPSPLPPPHKLGWALEDGQDLGGQECGGEGRLQTVEELSAIPRCFLVHYLVCLLEELP